MRETLKMLLTYPPNMQDIHNSLCPSLPSNSRLNRESESRGFRVKEVRFNEQVTKEPTYLLKNVLGGTILLEIAFSEPYFSVKVNNNLLNVR